MYETTEAGPSTYIPPHIPHDTPPTTQPTGGLSETAADAEQDRTITEEGESPVSDFYCSHIPRVTDCLFGVRRHDPETPTMSGSRRVPAGCGYGQKRMGGSGCSQATRPQ